jgi:hypothetical protein
MKIGRDVPLVASVLKRDGSRCVACDFDLNCALAAHPMLQSSPEL